MQSIKNRKLKERVHRNSGFFTVYGFKALILHKPKRAFQLNVMDLPLSLSFQYVVRIIKLNLGAKYQE